MGNNEVYSDHPRTGFFILPMENESNNAKNYLDEIISKRSSFRLPLTNTPPYNETCLVHQMKMR